MDNQLHYRMQRKWNEFLMRRRRIKLYNRIYIYSFFRYEEFYLLLENNKSREKSLLQLSREVNNNFHSLIR